MLTQKRFTEIVKNSGATLKNDRKTIMFVDDDLRDLSPSLTITSLEMAAAEVGRFAIEMRWDTEELLAEAWRLSIENWWPREWEICEDTQLYLLTSWKDLAIRLLIANQEEGA